jgi:hypothetical protein
VNDAPASAAPTTPQARPVVHVAWIAVETKVLVVATCEACDLRCERSIRNDRNAAGLALLVGAEALSAAGCTHVDAVTITRKTSLDPHIELLPAKP